jgi:endonuclease G
MKKLLLFIFLLPLLAGAQVPHSFVVEAVGPDYAERFADKHYIPTRDTVCLKHTSYTSYFIKAKHIPWVVSYTLLGNLMTCSWAVKRTDNFAPDPLCPEATNLNKDYARSGYDRGHNMPAEDNICNLDAMNECFYFSNMYPQTPNLNRGVWKELEEHERKEAMSDGVVTVYIGWYNEPGKDKYIGPDNVLVPGYCWKVLYDHKTQLWEAYIFPNADKVPGNYVDYKTTVADISGKSGIQFSVDSE